MAPHGHTISVSDIWYVAHAYGLLNTVLGEVLSVENIGVVTSTQHYIPCTRIVKCTGYWENNNVKAMLGSHNMYSNNVVRRNLAYFAEGILDSVGGYQNPVGSSYFEDVALGSIVMIDAYENDGCISPAGIYGDIV